VRKGPDCDYDTQNISVVIWDTDTLWRLTKSWYLTVHLLPLITRFSCTLVTIDTTVWPLHCSVCHNHNLVLSSLITWFVTRVTQWVPHVEQELLTLPEYLSSPPIFSGVCIARYLVFCVMFCRSLFVLMVTKKKYHKSDTFYSVLHTAYLQQDYNLQN
jgi:hypothetical protein